MAFRVQGMTYRVQGIPAAFTSEDCEWLLSSALQSQDESLEAVVHSLSPDPYHTENFKIATVTFNQIPDKFQNDKDQWTIPVTWPNNLGITTSLTVDCHFSGLTPLNSIRNDCDHKIDCVAITGLSSHPFGSWKQRGGDHMWLRDGLPHDLAGARVLCYGYNSKLVQSETFQSVDTIAKSFLETMRSIRVHEKGRSAPRPLIFISHSLGGIVLKRAISLMKDEDEICQEIFKSIYAVIFFGVPNQGFRVNHWLAMVRGQPNENLIHSLGVSSTYLRDLHRDFRTAFDFQDSQIVCVYETKQTRVARQEPNGQWTLTGEYEDLVPQGLATDSPVNAQGYREIPIQKDHSDMVKFSSRWDENYKIIRTCLVEFSIAAPNVIHARLSRVQDRRPRLESLGPADSAEWTALHHAAFQGDEDKFKELLKVYMDIETKDASGRTPLHIAAYHGKDVVLKILLDNDADQNAKNYSGQTPLYSAASRGYVSTVAILVARRAQMEVRDNERKTPLYTAARYGHELTVKLLIEKGANKEATAEGDWTPLHAAAWFGHESIVLLLVDSGADMEMKSQEEGLTPLHCSVENGHDAVISLLIERGADKTAKTASGQSALHIAAQFGRDTMLRVLLDQGCNIEAKDRDERTPLYVAAKAGHEKITRLLLERKAQTNVKAAGGFTPLHAAVWHGKESTSRALVEHSADTEVKSDYGETALFVAARYGNLEIVKLLVEHKADKRAKTNVQWRGKTMRWTPLKVADKNGHLRVVRYLQNS